MNEQANKKSRTLIGLIIALTLVQITILVYLVAFVWPRMGQQTAGPTPVPQETAAVEAPTAERIQPTPIAAVSDVTVGPLVEATSYVQRARMFDEEQALEHIIYLTSEELAGRQPGMPGGRAAGDYVAEHFSEYGLQPAGDDGTFFQSFSVPYGRVTERPLLNIVPPAGEILTRTYTYGMDYRAIVQGYAGAGEGEGQVVWLSECLSNDYLGQDVMGKIILCRNSSDVEVFRQAIEHRVGGMLLLDWEHGDLPFRLRSYRDTVWVAETIPAFVITPLVAEDLLLGSDYTLDDLSLLFAATPLSTTVSMAVVAEEQADAEARNVLGLLPGADPELSDEVVIIGAHYDHIGSDPDGVYMPGANDNASGVATILEIARMWQEQDFRPARSVIFAGWDGEEQGLLGSWHYVQHPVYPLTRTTAMLNLDMVGSPQPLNVDGTGPVASQLTASAEVYGITTTVRTEGRSDHIPFAESGVPAAMYIRWPDEYYHYPTDNVSAISPAGLASSGIATAHALASLAQEQTEVERALERMWATIATGDREMFLEGVDPTDESLQAAQAAWFDNLWSRQLEDLNMEPVEISVGDDEAGVSLRLTYSWVDAAGAPPSTFDARFVQRDDTWYLGGYDLDTLSGSAVTVARFPDVPEDAQTVLSRTQAAYLAITSDLGVAPVTSTQVIYYPNSTAMRAIARPAADRDTRWLVESAGIAEISWGQPVTAPLASLVLNQMGLPVGEAPWLREGLALYYGSGADQYTRLLASGEQFTDVLDLPDLDGLPREGADSARAYAWSATSFLLEQHGRQNLQDLCAAWGETGDENAAFQQALGYSPDDFEAAWIAAVIDPIRADAESIQTTLAARTEAAMSGDAARYMATIIADDPVLRTEEQNWFADLAQNPLASYNLTGVITEWSPGADEALVEVTADFVTADRTGGDVSHIARFVRQGEAWLYAGKDWDVLRSEHFVLKYQDHDETWAETILELAEAAYSQVISDLDRTPPLPQEIKIYQDSLVFRSSIAMSLPETAGWSEPGEAIRILLTQDDTRTIEGLLGHEIAHKVLYAQGLETSWLHEGVAAFEEGRVSALGPHWQAGLLLPIIQDAVRRQNELALEELPNTTEELLASDTELVYAQCWSLVTFVAEHQGLSGVRQLVSQSIDTGDAVSSLRAALGSDPVEAWEEWRQSVFQGAVPAELLELAQEFNPERALEDIAVLASPDYQGREAGTEGAEQAAAYIAQQFSAAGLIPLADPITDTDELGYLQRFPISHTHLISTPILTLLSPEGDTLYDFGYREEFLESGGEGLVESDLIWLRADSLEGLYFGGTVVIEQDVADPISRAATLAQRGAGGLVVVTDMQADDLQTSYARPTGGADWTIPVVQITEAAFDLLLGQMGMEQRDLSFAPPTLYLGAQMQLSIARSSFTTTLTSNVVGFLPGSDPGLADEVLLIGANYDHIGQSPNGLYFPGANRNASGVAAMLELARIWSAERFQPGRSVLFVAWGADELAAPGLDGTLEYPGVTHYLSSPPISPSQTVGVIALDSIGAGSGYRMLFYGTRETDTPLIWQVEAGAGQLGRPVWRRGSTGDGWHARFGAAGIPTVKLIWDRAEEDFYLPTDTVDYIDIDTLASSGEVLVLTASWLTSR